MSNVLISELDALVESFICLRNDYEAKKKIASEASADLQKAEMLLLDMLKVANKSQYKVDGVGSVTKVTKLSFKVPKDPTDKQKFFNYIEEKHGPDVLIALQSINSISLNSFLKDAVETPPGIEPPTSYESLKFTRS